MARVVGFLLDLGDWCFENPGVTAVLLIVFFLGVIVLAEKQPAKKEAA